MSQECTHDCSTCSSNCSSRKEPQDLRASLCPGSRVSHVIGVVSGKGGVGKSMVTSMLAVNLARIGYHVGILDADITGPSIPKAFGVNEPVEGDGEHMLPPVTNSGIDIMSANLLLDSEDQPIIWRGSLIAGTVKQFWSDTLWKDVDYMVVDCPPGTGDVPLTVFQSIPLDGIVIVTSPQDLVSMIVAKAVNMAKMMGVPVIGLVENMSYVKCPDCGKELHVFGESHIEEIAARYDVPFLGRLPIDPALAALVDAGQIEGHNAEYLDDATQAVLNATQK
jgi:Mrp family chromosome partitioning ATPase